MKKNSSRLLTPDEIIKGFKAKGKLVKGYKDNYYRPKIATIWYLLTNRTITSYLVDELELYSILTNNMFEVLAIQLFVGGYYCKGNGIFEHKMKSDKNNYRSYHTYEYIDKVTNNGTTLNNHYTHENGQTTIVNYNHNTQIVNNSPFTNYSKEKITIIDKQHETLKATTRRIVKHLEFSSGCRVKKIKLQYIFNSSWYPYIVSATNVILSNLPVNSTSGLNNFLYIDGIVPKLPAFSHKSFLLPQHWEDYQKKPNRFIEDDTPLNNNDVFTTDNISSGSPNKESTTVSKLDSSLKPESTVDSPKFPARKRTVNASSRKSSAMMENSEVTAEDIQRSMDELTSNLYTTNHVRFEDTDDVMSIDDDNIYGSHNNQRKKSSTEIIQEADYGPPISAVELAKLFSDTRTGRAESARATIAVGSRDYVLHQLHSENPSSENGELSSNLQKQKGRSSSSVGLVQRLMDNTATARRASTVSSRRPSNKENNLSTLAMGGESNTKFPPGFQQATLISDMRQNYYANQVKDQDVIAREEPRQPPRRPVSAPSNR